MTEVRRNQWGQYLVLEPGGTKERGYVRVTTVAKTLDDGGGLIPWKATAVMVGASRRPGLAAKWQALISGTPDPWYGSPKSKEKCKELVEECATAGGSTDRAEIGTALHALCEQMDRGHTLVGVTPAIQADLDAYTATIQAAGITFDTDMIETLVVLDEWQVAGTADRLSARLPDGRIVVADLKTGASLDYSWQSIAVQLAAYANADHRYEQLEVGGRRLPMPDLDRTVGLVIHLPAGEARCELYTVDLVAGWEAFQRSMWTRGWRKNRKLSTLYGGSCPTTSTTVSLNSAGSSPGSPTPSTILTTSVSNSSTPPNSSLTPSADSPTADPDDAFTSLVLANAMTEWPPTLRQHLKEWWPDGYPTPGQVRRHEAVWTDEQIALIGKLCDLGDAPFWHESSPILGRFAVLETVTTVE